MNEFQNLHARMQQENQLHSVLLELTYRCNLDCFFCYNDLSLHGRPMRLEDYKRLLDDLVEMNVLTVVLSGGEPLAYPGFFDLGAYARNLGFVIRVKTNGHAVGPAMSKRLREVVDPFMIETSLHGATSETHDRQTRVPGSFERLVKNIRAMRQEGLRVEVNSTLTAWNEHEVAAMHELTDELGTVLRFNPEVSPRDDGDAEPLDIRPSDEGIANMYRIGMQRALAHSAASEPAAIPVRLPGQSAPAKQRYKNCGTGSTHLTVDPYGNVYPCVQLRRKIGNLHETRIAEIWRGSDALDRIRELAYEAFDVREKHGLKGFCPGLAEVTTGDPLAVTPDAARKARILTELSRKQPASG